jgi:His/Glu/Gln/Arg/opine family amino acid ABC transporter permease subunit
MINISLIQEALPHLLRGSAMSIFIASVSLLIGIVSGTLWAILQTRGGRVTSFLVTLYITIVRGTPMLIQIVCMYYVLSMAGFMLSATVAAILAIGMNSGAYISQIVRAGIHAVPKGQIEAAYTLGIKQTDTMRFIVLPQALRVVFPALANEAITLIKDSSLASLIGVVELYKEGQTIISQTYDALSIYVVVAALYLIMTTSLSYYANYIERRLNHHVKNY